MADLRCKFDSQIQDRGWIWTMNLTINISDNLFCSNSSPILELSIKFASHIFHENINKPLDGTYLADFGIDITSKYIIYINWLGSVNSRFIIRLHKGQLMCPQSHCTVESPGAFSMLIEMLSGCVMLLGPNKVPMFWKEK